MVLNLPRSHVGLVDRNGVVGIASRQGDADRMPVGARFPARVQFGPGIGLASCMQWAPSHFGGLRFRGFELTTHPF